MRILFLSDLNWEAHLRSITTTEVQQFTEERLSLLRYERIRRYFNLILSEKADLVLFSGDITGDGSCGHGFHAAFTILLQLLENRQIPSAFIRGNHDPEPYYTNLLAYCSDFKYTQEISEKKVKVLGLNILGVSYDCSKSKRKLNALIAAHKDSSLDIVLAHSQIKRRIYHFDFNTEYILTGHYDRKLLAHRDTVFLALDNDSEEISYAVLDKNKQKDDIVGIKIKRNEDVFALYENKTSLLAGQRTVVLHLNDEPYLDLLKLENASNEALSRDGLHYLYLKYLRGINYSSSLDSMYHMKHHKSLDKFDLSLNQLHGLPITANYQISESMIEDYLGDVIE